jgi:nitrous oxidase accessory protein NosD
MRQGDWKLLTNDDGNGTELYNLKGDAAERTDVSARHSGIVTEMKGKLLAWRKTLSRPEQSKDARK